MELPERDDAAGWVGQEVLDEHGGTVGRCQHVYADDATGLPEWIVVELTDGTRAFVPLTDAFSRDGRVHVPFTAQAMSTAPLFPDSGRLDPEDEIRLFEHYRVPYSREASRSLLPTGRPEPEDEPVGTGGAAAGVVSEPLTLVADETATGPVVAPVVTGTGIAAEPVVEPAPAVAAVPAVTPVPDSAAPGRRPLPVDAEPALLGGLALALAVLAAVRVLRSRRAETPVGRARALRGSAAAGGQELAGRARRGGSRAAAQARRGGAAAAEAARRQELLTPERRDELVSAGAELGRVVRERGGALAATGSARALELASTATVRGKELAEAGQSRGGELAKSAAARREELAKAAGQRREELAKAAAQRRKELAKSGAQRRKELAKAGAQRRKELAKAGGRARGAGSAVLSAPSQPVAAVAGTGARAGRKARRSVRRTSRRVSLLLGLAAGYVAGARAGRERYDEIAAGASQLAERPEVQQGRERVRNLLGSSS